MRKSIIISVVSVVMFFLCSYVTPINAVEVSPSENQIKEAVLSGKKMKDSPEKLFEPYEFGKRGVETNGYMMTKLFQISQRAAKFARENKAVQKDSFDDILQQNYLLFPLYLIAASEKGLESISVEMRQGIRTIKAGKIIEDPIEKTMCKGEICLYKRDVYAGFYYKDFDPARLAVLVVKTGKKTEEFPLSLSDFK